MRSAALQPPDQSTANDQQNRNQLRSRHQPAEDFTASGIVAQKLDEVTLDSVEDHETGPHLTIELLPSKQPGQQQKIAKLSCGFNQLCRLNLETERGSTDGVRQGICENYTPEVVGRFAVTAARRETTKASKNVPKRKTGSKAVTGAQCRHVMTPNVPGGHEQPGNQSAGEYASRLERIEAENFAPVIGVGAPVVNDVKNFCADNSGELNHDAKVPGIVAVDALLLGIAYADPKPDQNARGDENTVGGQVEAANLKKSGEHVVLDAPNEA